MRLFPQCRKTLYVLLGFFMVLPSFLRAQQAAPDCTDLRAGQFYFYSQKGYSSVFVREDYLQKEFNSDLGDTTLWRITWLSDCRYELAYVSGNRALDALAKESMIDLITEVQVTEKTPQYYRFQSTNKASGAVVLTDTLWREAHPEKIDKRTVVAAAFPGGPRAWNAYLESAFVRNAKPLRKKGVEGTCLVRFVVDADGTVSEVTALTLKGTLVAETAVKAIKDGPKWIPCTVDGQPTKTLKVQPITYQL